MKKIKTLLYSLLGLFAVLAIIFSAIKVYFHPLLEHSLSRANVGNFSLADAKLTHKSILLKTLALNDHSITIDSVTVHYTPVTLFKSRSADLIEIDGVTISQKSEASSDSNFDIAAITAQLRGLNLFSREVVIKNGRMTSPPLSFEGRALNENGTYLVTGTVTDIEKPQEPLAVIDGDLSTLTGAAKLKAGLNNFSFNQGGVEIRRLSGDVTLDLSAEGKLGAKGTFAAGLMTAGEQNFEDLSLTFSDEPAASIPTLNIDLSGRLKSADKSSVSAKAQVSYNAPEQKIGVRLLDASFPVNGIKMTKPTADIAIYGLQTAEGNLQIEKIESTATPPLFTPLNVKASMHSLSSQKDALGIKFDVTGQNGALAISGSGRHDLAGNKGSMKISLAPLALKPGVYDLKDFIPVSTKYVSDTEGQIAATANLSWSKNEKGWRLNDQKGSLLLRDLGATYGGFPAKGINGVIDIDSLMPVTFKDQQVALGAFTAGLPLQNGLFTFGLDKQKNFSLTNGRMEMAKGVVTIDPFTLNLDQRQGNITLAAASLDLEELFKMSPLEGLSATGKVSGRLPLRVDSADIFLEGGVLESDGSGFLKYSPQEMPAFLRDNTSQHIIDLKTALAGFAYDTLRLTMDGNLLKEQKIGLSLGGKNPLFYEGHPVKFNINVEGPLQSIVKYAPGSSSIPDNIQKKLEEFEEKNATANNP